MGNIITNFPKEDNIIVKSNEKQVGNQTKIIFKDEDLEYDKKHSTYSFILSPTEMVSILS